MSKSTSAPRCPKCGGALAPDWDVITRRTISVGCINCGWRVFQGVVVRRPGNSETNTVKGISKSGGVTLS